MEMGLCKGAIVSKFVREAFTKTKKAEEGHQRQVAARRLQLLSIVGMCCEPFFHPDKPKATGLIHCYCASSISNVVFVIHTGVSSADYDARVEEIAATCSNLFSGTTETHTYFYWAPGSSLGSKSMM